jgi:hypothetical protein
MKAYLIILGSFLDRKLVQVFLNTVEEIPFWYSCLPRCIFATSSLSASELAMRIRSRFPKGRFLVMEAHGNRQGILPRSAWNMMRDPNNPKG